MQTKIISVIIFLAVLCGTVWAQGNIEKTVRILFVDEQGNSLRNLYVEHRYSTMMGAKQMANSEKVGTWFLLSPDYYAESARQEDGMFHLTLPFHRVDRHNHPPYHTLAARTKDRSLGGYFLLSSNTGNEPIVLTLTPYHKVSMKFISAVDGEPLRNTTLSGLLLHRESPSPASAYSQYGWYHDRLLVTNDDGVVTFDCLPGTTELRCEQRPGRIWSIESRAGATAVIAEDNGVVNINSDMIEEAFPSNVRPLHVWRIKPNTEDSVIDIGTIAYYGKWTDQWKQGNKAVVLDKNGRDAWNVNVFNRFSEAQEIGGSLEVQFEEAFSRAKKNGRNVLFIAHGFSDYHILRDYPDQRPFFNPFEFVSIHAPRGIGRESRTFQVLRKMTGQEIPLDAFMVAFSADGEFLGVISHEDWSGNWNSRGGRRLRDEHRKQFLESHTPQAPEKKSGDWE